MKSKSFDMSETSADNNIKQNRTFDFVNLYKSAALSNVSWADKSKPKNDKESDHDQSGPSKREKIRSKRNKKEKRESIDISEMNVDGAGLSTNDGSGMVLNDSKVTSTPLGSRRSQAKADKMKSIIKTPEAAATNEIIDSPQLDVAKTKSKKRNKSVSFMLEDNEEVMVKKTKPSNTVETNPAVPTTKVKSNKQFNKHKKDQAEKENKIHTNQAESVKSKTEKKFTTKYFRATPVNKPINPDNPQPDKHSENKRKSRRSRKIKKLEENIGSQEASEETSANTEKQKKPKKKKHQEKLDVDNDEPALKARKEAPKEDVIADLENLSIGDNAHTLTNLLDEMTVVDKGKKKKLRQKPQKKPEANQTEETNTPENVDKVKWRRRKWNKDIKADVKEDSLDTTILVENLPLSLLFSFKKLLAEHFVKYGLVKTVGIAEVYPTEDSTHVFTTTVNFYSDGAATQALQEDNTVFEGSKIRVKRPLPPTETTLVVRSYGALTAQFLSSVFSVAGRIRNIRHLVKGKHGIVTFFVELDGPEAVERAMSLAANVKAGGKKVYVSKFETRVKKNKAESEKNNDEDGSDEQCGELQE